MRELRRLAAVEAIDIGPEVTPYEAMPMLLQRSWSWWRFFSDKVDNLDEDKFWLTDPRTGERVPGAEFELEQRMLTVVKSVCNDMMRLDIDERGAQIEEAKLQVLGVAIAAAAQEAGLTEDQQKLLGKELRKQLEAITLDAKAA